MLEDSSYCYQSKTREGDLKSDDNLIVLIMAFTSLGFPNPGSCGLSKRQRLFKFNVALQNVISAFGHRFIMDLQVGDIGMTGQSEFFGASVFIVTETWRSCLSPLPGTDISM